MHSDSMRSKNLKACNNFRLYDGNAALDDLNALGMDELLLQDDMLRHNMVVFKDGHMAPQTLPSLLDMISEARPNLALFHLRDDDCEEAEALLDDFEPFTPSEFITKAVVKATVGNSQGDMKRIREAKSYFLTIGKSPTETDTLPGRQSMGSALFLEKKFDDANIYFSSIKDYMCEYSLLAKHDFIEVSKINHGSSQ